MRHAVGGTTIDFNDLIARLEREEGDEHFGWQFPGVLYFHSPVSCSWSIVSQFQNEQRNGEFSSTANTKSKARSWIGSLKIHREVIIGGRGLKKIIQ